MTDARGSSRVRPITAALTAALLLAPALGAAQPSSRARRRVAAGEVTGLEMGIDGSLRAVPGGRVRWFVTLYEVLRRRDLRPAPGATLRVTASFVRGGPIQVVQTDAAGHATLEIPIPRDLESTPHIRVEAESPRHVRRVFSVSLLNVPAHLVDLYVDRTRAPVGGTLGVLGRVSSAATGLPIAGEEVTLQLSEGTQVDAVTTVTTDARGVFTVDALRLPSRVAPRLALSARTRHGAASRALQTVEVARPALWVETRAPDLVAPGQTIDVDVFVRTVSGEPLPGARLAWQGAGEDEPSPVTDAEGRARIEWQAPSTISEPMREEPRTLIVTDPGRGTVHRTIAVRVSRVPFLTSWVVDAGALAPGLTGRVFVRVVTPDGAPHRGPVTLEIARLGGSIVSTTDDDGVAIFEGPVALGADGGSCGATATEATLVVEEHRERLCLPLDPDATLRVGSVQRAADRLDVRVERAAAARRAPVEVTALIHRGGGWEPISRAYAGAADGAVGLPLPEHARGEIWVRARPVLDGGVAARGGSRLVYRRWPSRPSEAFSVEASESGARVSALEGATVAVYAGDPVRLIRAVRARLGPVGAALERGRSAGFVEALLAARTPADVAASVNLRAGGRVTQPMPSEPPREGLLRDPWRTRARFIRGRVGQLMRAVEDYVDASVPDSIDEVGVRDGRGWRFNQELLDAAIRGRGLGEETATALDGEPLDLEGLGALDASFTFDGVAARITRQRLFRVLVMLRTLTRARDLDLPWGRRGDPRDLVVSLLDVASTMSFPPELTPQRRYLFDGWGQPFVLRRVRGRARFRFLTPVDGWELVSAGPDGRIGTRDDMADPFARVLPSSGIYAEAAGEDILLARLSGVALGRATLASLRDAFDIPHEGRPEDRSTRARPDWDSLPGPVQRPWVRPPALDPLPDRIGGVGVGVEGTLTWALPSALRTYRVAALRFGADGGLGLAEGEFTAGAPFVARLAIPPTLRPGDALRVPIELVRLADAPTPTVEVFVAGRGVEAHVDGLRIDLRATRPGVAQLSVVVRAGEHVVSRFERRVRVMPEGMLRSRVSVARVEGTETLSVTLPDDARPWRTRLTVSAPRALAADPAFVTARAEAPGIFAWAQTMAGADVDPDLLAGATEARGALRLACAMVAWAGHQRYVGRVDATVQRLRERLGDDLSLRASILSAVASAAPSGPSGGDPTTRLVTELREDGWRVLARSGASPSVMARMAAGLLLADRDDGRGRALLHRAQEALREDGRGRRWVPGERARTGDAWIGTLALAVAARQVGEDALADELGAAALSRLYLADRTGPQGAFWALAASVYGVFGVDGPASVDARIGDQTRTLSLNARVIDLELEAGAEVQITTTAPTIARLEARYLVPVVARSDGALRARVEGAAGRAGRTSGLELVVTNATEEATGASVVEIVVPSAAVLDAAAREAMLRVDGVSRVSAPDGAGVARVHLAPLPEGAERRVPLPWRWVGSGRSAGLALVAYDASTPHLRFVREGRTLTIEEAP